MKKTILIVGAGLAGLSAALQAAKEEQCNIKLISLTPSERAQSVMAEGGINAALNTKGEDDEPKWHYEDTIKAGVGLADENAVWGMTKEAPAIVSWLHHIGVLFNTCENDEIDLRNFGGQKKKRTAFAKSDTGKQLMTALIDAVREKEVTGQIERFSHHAFETLLVSGKTCCGCIISDQYTGKSYRLLGDAVIIATGGMHGVFGNTTGSLFNTGQVSAQLFRLGVPMANLEMVQYHPTTVEIGGKRMLISEAARGEGGRLFSYRNGKKWYFMEEKYPKLGNLMPRDITAREIWSVAKEGKVFLDLTEIKKETMNKKLAGLVDDCLTYLNKDIRKEPIEVYPGIHYFMGGIYVDEQHRTAIKNLYAAGECCAQYHGANRLGGNSLLGAIYGGKVAAKTACKEMANDMSRPNATATDGDEMPDFEQSNYEKTMNLDDNGKLDIKKLNDVMLETMGIVRNEATLKSGIEQVEQMEGNLALLGCAMLKSALARKESRGAHWREDYPQKNDEKFQKTTIATYDGDTISISFEAIPKRKD